MTWPSARLLCAGVLLMAASGCSGPPRDWSVVAQLRSGANAADVRAWLGEPRHQGRGSKPYWTYHWRAPGKAEGCQLLVAFDSYSGRVVAYQVDLFRPYRALTVAAWPGRAPDASYVDQCLRGAPPT